MEVAIIKIGNSKGIRLSKTIIEKYKLKDKVNLIFEDHRIVIEPKKLPREGWGGAFAEMAKNGDGNLLIDDVFTDENIEEW